MILAVSLALLINSIFCIEELATTVYMYTFSKKKVGTVQLIDFQLKIHIQTTTNDYRRLNEEIFPAKIIDLFVT